MKQELRIRELINRIARLDAAQAWQGDLNPTQMSVLEYLNRANKFSKSPSHVADFLGSTRGTISQSLKSLVQKGYLVERKSLTDRRTVSFDLTNKGEQIARSPNAVSHAVETLDETSSDAIVIALEALALRLLEGNGRRAFGVCNQCTHFTSTQNGGRCTLLSADLSPPETLKICHEQVPI